MVEIDWLKFTDKKRAWQKNKLNPQMRDWILPPWFEKQNNPFEKSYSIGTIDFINLASRNWVTLYAKNKDDHILVDLYGTVHLPKMGISVETWIRYDDKLYTPGKFLEIESRLCPFYRGLGFTFDYNSGLCRIILSPVEVAGSSLIQTQVSIVNKSIDSLKSMGLLFVVRPFDNNGMSPVKSLEYRSRYLLVNGKKMLLFEKEPSFSFFSNARLGDVTQYLECGEGNEKVQAMDGSCTGMLGFSGLPEELKDIRLFITTGLFSESLRKRNIFDLSGKKHNHLNAEKTWVERLSQNINLIKTHTKLDEMYLANLVHLETFCKITDEVNIYQILAYNRLYLTGKSKNYLEMCLKKVRWDGSTPEQLLGTSRLIYAILDYYHFTGDINFIKRHWLVLERLGSWLTEVSMKTNHTLDNSHDSFSEVLRAYESNFWVCAGLKALAKLGGLINRAAESQGYKEEYLSLKGKLLQHFTNAVKHKPIAGVKVPDMGDGGQMARSLSASYPLQIFDINERVIRDVIDIILKKHLYNGAVISPLDFKGIDPELTARLGQVLVREGFNCNRILNSLLKYAGAAWSWPDRINPVSKEGIGKNGHDVKVLYQVLLFLRSIMVMEDDEILYLLPGIFTSSFWKKPHLKIQGLPTYFGNLSFQCRSIGNMIQIDYQPEYRSKPDKIRLMVPITCKILFCDREIQYQSPILEIDPDFRLLRFRKE